MGTGIPRLDRLPPGPDPPRRVHAIIEIPRGSRNKYEYDPGLGVFRLDRVLYAAVHYPADYGFVPGTLAGDGDALDILVETNEPTFPGCLIECRPVGLLRMRDEAGEDEKVLAVPVADPLYGDVKELGDVRRHFLEEIEHFFRSYKVLEGKPTTTLGWEARAVAEQRILESIARAEGHRGG